MFLGQFVIKEAKSDEMCSKKHNWKGPKQTNSKVGKIQKSQGTTSKVAAFDLQNIKIRPVLKIYLHFTPLHQTVFFHIQKMSHVVEIPLLGA